MIISRRTALRACAGLAATVAPCARAATDVPLNEQRLTIKGNQLLRGGKPIRLNGVAVADPVFVRKGRTLDDYRLIADEWQCNVVRISLHPCHWRESPSKAFAALAADITGARARGLVVILDWHAIGFPGGYVERPDPSWGLPQDAYLSDVPLALSFWREMAESFGRDPGIIFELWNEPIVDDKLITSTGRHWPQLKALWQRLLAVIRTSSDNIVLASGDRFAHDLKGVADDLIDDPQVAYAWHCYPLFDKTLPNRWHVSLDRLPRLKPVFVTEWGFCRGCEIHLSGTPEDFGRAFERECLVAYGLHSTAWVWSAAAGPAMLTPDGPPTEFGSFVKQQIARGRAVANKT
jgi:hypothetical protein